MAPIATFVFFDLEATGLIEGTDIPRITELGMIAVKRKHFLNTKADEELRVQYKFRMCFNPHKPISKRSAELSGLTNELLNEEADLNYEAFNAISSFINCLQKPVCLIAHNGYDYHFPIFKYYFPHLSLDVMCADSLHAFYDLQKEEETGEIGHDDFDENQKEQPFIQLWRQRFYWPDSWPTDSYKLKDVYARVVEGTRLLGNRAENHCTMMLKIACSSESRAHRFNRWVALNHCRLLEVPVPLEKMSY